jgi:tartronate-semialdehyde synthase
VRDPEELVAGFEKALAMMAEFGVPVVVEVILEKVTNIAMAAAQLDDVTEFEEVVDIGVASDGA